ncbi:MAG: DsrE family protein [Flammeovirgaceae bacterium]|nr:MAG: DsrE family protein [Flammeovirgaceae bacterium]
MKYLALLLVLTGLSGAASGQANPQVLLHLQTGDTLVYKALVNQIVNLKKEIPQAAVKIVCHGPGMGFLLKSQSEYAERIHHARLREVAFIGCEFTMKQRQIKPEQLVPYATTVPYGLVEIVKLQQAGWLYIKTGF